MTNKVDYEEVLAGLDIISQNRHLINTDRDAALAAYRLLDRLVTTANQRNNKGQAWLDLCNQLFTELRVD